MAAARTNGLPRFIWLIASSLTLLTAFQVLWLRQVWHEQREALRQEVDNVFQRSVLALQDSLSRRAMRRNGLSPDSLRLRLPPPLLPPSARRMMHLEKSEVRTIITHDSAKVLGARPDSLNLEKVQVFITTGEEEPDRSPEMPAGVDRLLLNWQGSDRQQVEGKFILRIEKDTLSTEELSSYYQTALYEAGIDLNFQLRDYDELRGPDSTALSTQPARAGLLTYRAYTAVFPQYQGYIFRRILPYGLFSLLLLGITTTAFVAIWRSLRRQQRLTKFKNDFIANITHELKTPLTTVGVALEALSDFEVRHDPARTREYLDISKLELERLGLLVDKVLHLSHFEQAEPSLHPEPLDLAELVRQVLGALKLPAARVGAVLHFAPAADRDFTVSGDRLHLSGVVFNLVDNALKYGRGRPEINVALERDDRSVHLTVSDNGPGIAPEFQAKIFEKFFRVPAQGNVHDVKGHGLGLSYAAEVMRLHGGSLRVESRENEGSRFVLTLPALPH